MKISPTERASYKRCRRQWMVGSRSRWGITRIVAPHALALGTLVHDTLGLWLEMYKREQELLAAGLVAEAAEFICPPDGLGKLFLQYAEQAIEKAHTVYAKQVGVRMSEGELAPLYESLQLGSSMMNNYQRRWKQPVPDGFDIIETEMRVTVTIPGTEHTSEWVWEPAADAASAPPSVRATLGQVVQRVYATPRYHMYEGRLDGVLRERKTNRLFVLEHKTYGQRPREDVLFSNDQFLSYHWMLLRLAGQMELSERDVAGVAYDGLWKRAAPPKVVDGHAGSLHDLFSRKLITRPVQELIEFEGMLAQEVLEMASNPAIYLNRTSDGSCFYGCSHNQLCLAMSRDEDVDYMLKSKYTTKSDDTDLVAPRDV